MYSAASQWIDGLPLQDQAMPDLRADEVPRPSDDHGHKVSSTWVQIAIIAMNSASEASAAASWIRVLNMGSLPGASNANASGRVPVGR